MGGPGSAGQRRLRTVRRHRRHQGWHVDRPQPEAAARVCERTDRPVVASGGVAKLDDIAALRSLVPEGVEGAIVGRSTQAFTLLQAMAVAG